MKYTFPSGAFPKLNPHSGQALGLVAWYPITQYDSAQRLIDHSGNGYDALVVSATDPAIGGTVRGIAADFTAPNSKNYQADFALGGTFTICARYYGTVDRVVGVLCATKLPGGAFGQVMAADGGAENKISTWSSPNSWLRGSTTVTDTLNSWIDVIVSIDGTNTIKLFVNGELEATDISVAPFASNTDGFVVGGDINQVTQYIQGFLKDVRVYDKAFTDTEAFAYTNPATRYELWAKPVPVSLATVLSLTTGTCVATLPTVTGTLEQEGGTCVASLPVVSGTIPILTTGTCVATLPVVTGIVVEKIFGTGTCVAAVPEVTGLLTENLVIGSVVTTLPTVSGTAPKGIVGQGACIASTPLVTATVANGNVGLGAIQAPCPIVVAVAGISATVQPSLAIVNSTSLTGGISVGMVIAKAPQISVGYTNSAVWSGNVSAPIPVVSAVVETGNTSIAAIVNRISSVTVLGHSGVVGQATINLPSRSVEGASYQNQLMIGEVVAPFPVVQGVGTATAIFFLAWALNTESKQVSNYTQFPFIALGKIGTTPAGATTDGIYLLEGADDAGQPVDAVLRFGMADFGSNALTQINDVYVGGEFESDMELSLRSDGEVTEYTYPLVKRGEHIQGHRAKLGRGFRSRYRQVSIMNVDGADFTIDNIILPQNETEIPE